MTEQTWFQEQASEIVKLPFCGGSVMGCSYRCPDKSTDNEDAAAVIQVSENHGVLVVADGVGGQNAGDRAARETIESILDHCRNAQSIGSLRPLLVDAIEAANHKILKWGIGAGATLVVAEYFNRSVQIIHVGDASVILCSNRGRIKFFSVAHAPVAMAVEIGILDETEALVHEDRNIISNCVGATDMKIEIGPRIPMAARDTLIMGSDGLFDNLTSEEIVNAVRAGNLQRQTSQLIEITRLRMAKADGFQGKADDLTVLCFRQS